MHVIREAISEAVENTTVTKRDLVTELSPIKVELATVKTELAVVKTELSVLKWMVGAVLLAVLTPLLKGTFV